jgi:tellurite resistance protein
MSPSRLLPRIPASFFGIVIGTVGLAADWRLAHRTWGFPAAIGESLFVVGGLIWLVVSVLYGLKWVIAFEEARQEAEHAVQCCFIGLGGVTTTLIAQGILPYSRMSSVILFGAGALFTLAFALWRTGTLWHGTRPESATTAVLYLPTVAGGFVAGNTAAQLGWPEYGQLAFGAAFFSWLAIESVLLHRLYTGEVLPPALRPTLGIQLAPPAVGAASYLAVGTGNVDVLANALIGYALLQALLLARMAKWIGEMGFTPAFWAFSFGATSLTGAVMRLSVQPHGAALGKLAPFLFGVTNILLLVFVAGTLRLLLHGNLLPRNTSTLGSGPIGHSVQSHGSL